MEFCKGQTFTISGQHYWLDLTLPLRQSGRQQSRLLYQICVERVVRVGTAETEQ